MALVKENKIFICQTSRIISMDCIYHSIDDTFYNDHTKIMYNAVQKSMVRYNNFLMWMCKDKFDDVVISVLSTIADDLFRDKTCNWGHIFSLFTFCGTLAKQSASKDMYKTIDDIALFLGSYIADNLTEWIYKQSGWVSIFMVNLLFFMMYELYVNRPIFFEIIIICLSFFQKDFDISFDCN